MNTENPTINGKPATKEQFQRVLFLQEKKRRIEAESKLLTFEAQAVDSELDAIISSVEKAATAVKEVEEGAA